MTADQTRDVVYRLRDSNPLYVRAQGAIERASAKGDFEVEIPYPKEEQNEDGEALLFMDGFFLTQVEDRKEGKIVLRIDWKPGQSTLKPGRYSDE